ncbi:MAG TPA: aspartate ammonia-lyase [Planctomycetaceae bacterium]|nr:aspartate ammonia-lyase [Planctomycetaceae bacterium]
MYRIEYDSMGEVRLPRDVYYGAQTQRAVENFPVSGKGLPKPLIHALGLVKWAAAKVNGDLGMLTTRVKRPLGGNEWNALLTAAREVSEGKFDDQFPIDVYQTGSGTSSNMNANEVVSNRACELAGYDRFDREKPIHPNDHVNFGQSTNDIFPTAIHVAVVSLILDRLLPVLDKAIATLAEKAGAWQSILKIGRTHLADATPLTLGQEFSGFARQLERTRDMALEASAFLTELPAGGTAVGTGINTHPEFGKRVAAFLSEHVAHGGAAFREAQNHFEANAQRDGLVAAHALIKTVATVFLNVANNIRWLGSGPRCGFYEILIPDLQPGSSIMPGKINPVLCESLMQVAAKVIGNDQTMTTCGAIGGQFQLNIMMPVMGDVAIESVSILAGAIESFWNKCLLGLEANEERCRASVEQSLSLVTGLNTLIGYEQAAWLAKEAFASGKTIRELVVERQLLTPEQIDTGLDPWKMIRPLEE